MAIFHLSVTTYSRGKGHAVIAAAAYISRAKLYDKYYGVTHDFTGKKDLVYFNSYLPSNAPKEYYDQATRWNAVEKSERRKNSRLARGIKIALPVELSLDEQVRLVVQYVTANFVDKGMCADVAIHDMGDGNPHVHCLLSTRDISEAGFGKKNREWDKSGNVTLWRREWAKMLNHELERRGIEPVSHESYVVQDFGKVAHRIPNIHIGPQVQKLARMGIETDRMNEYLDIVENNRELKRKRQQERERRLSQGRER